MPGMSHGTFSRVDIGGRWMCIERIEDMSNRSVMNSNDDVSCGYPYEIEDAIDEGIHVPKLKILMRPRPEDLDVLLPWIGTAETSDTFALTSAAASETLLIDRVETVDDCGNAYVDKAIFRGNRGRGGMSLELQVICDQFPDIDGGTWSATAPTSTAPYPFHRASLTAEGGTKSFASFVFVHDNKLVVNWNNSQTPNAFEIGKRKFTLGVDTPYTSSETALITAPISDIAGTSGNVTFTRGGQSFVISANSLVPEVNPPDVVHNEEIRLKTFWTCYGSTSNKPVTYTNDPVA